MAREEGGKDDKNREKVIRRYTKWHVCKETNIQKWGDTMDERAHRKSPE